MAQQRSDLTERQQQTMELLAQGYTSKHIAAQVGISAQAVDRRVQALLRKTGCRDRGELVRWQLQRSGLSSAPKTNLGADPDADPSSTSERITADLDLGSRLPPHLPVQPKVTSDPETQSGSGRAITRKEWLGMEVTWLQVILIIMALREAYEILS